MNKNFILGITCLSFFCSCKQTIASKDAVEVLNISHVDNKLKMSDFSSSIDLIPLQTSDSVIIGDIVRIVNLNNLIYVADKSTLYKFDNSGKIIDSFCKRGKGPTEYAQISDFQVLEDGSCWILSRSSQRLFHYSNKGQVIKNIKLSCWAAKIKLMDKNTMLLYVGNEKDENNSYQLKVMDLESEQIKNDLLPIDDKKSKYLHVWMDNCFSNDENNNYFFQLFCDTIYTVSPKGIHPQYYINLDNKNIPDSFFDSEYSNIMDFFNKMSSMNYAYATSLFMKKGDKFWISYLSNGIRYFSVLENGICKTTSIFGNPSVNPVGFHS